MPHFTGRENECDEIIGHVTSESTRIVSIWGSPGFGKTSVAIKVGHHLQSEGIPVYFLSLRGLRLKADLTSKLLSFLRTSSNEPCSQPLSLDDELCELFSRVVGRCIFILDNADDLFENGATDVKEQVVNLLGEILGRNERVTFILTTRESLEFMNIHFQGLQTVRIRPLEKHSSENLVHKLLAPNASSSDCNRIIQICGRVPLAIKLVCSSISEDNAQPTQFLDEFMADKESSIIDILDEPDSNDLRLQFLFDSSFRRLSTQEKEVLVSLSILPENFSQDVAAAVLNLTRFSATKILQRLRRKSLIDSSSKPGSFQIHSLFQSFAREKGEQEMKETLLTSRARFYEFYISLFEKLNKQFLTGQSKSAFDQFYENKQYIMQSLTEGCTFCTTADIVFNALVGAELFVSSVFLTGGGAMLYDSAIKAANNLKTIAFYRQLIVSRALFDVPLGAGGATMQLLSKAKGIQALPASVVDGEEGKNLCFSGVCLLVAGKTEQGVQVLKEALPLLKDIPDQTVLRLSVCQILAIYYRLRKDSSSFRQFYSKALQECKAAGDTQLLVIPEMESTGQTNDQESMSRRGSNNHPLQLQVILLVTLATSSFSDFETKHYVNNAALEILKDNENGAQHSSPGLSQFQRNVICFFYVCNKIEGAAKLSEASINYLEKALRQCKSNQEELQRRTKHFPEDDTLHQESLSKSFWDLGSFQHLKGNFLEAIRAFHSALDIRLMLFGEKHSSTAESYHSLGCAQLAYGEFASALQSAKHAIFIRLKLFGEEHSSTAESYLLLGLAQRAQGDFTSTLQSFQRVLDIRLKLFGEEHVSTAESYLLLGDAQYAHVQDDFSSALQSAKRALHIRLKLFGEEHTGTADSYVFLGNVQYAQRDFMPAIESYRRALEIRRKLSGEEHTGTADSYVLLGEAQCGQHDFVSALKSYQRALDIRLKLFGEEHQSTADSYHLLAETQSSQGDEGSALQSFERALDIRLKLFGEDHSSTADSYSALGQTQFFQGDFTSALQSFKRALCIRRKLFGEEHSITAHSYWSLGDTQRAQGDLTSAIHSLQRSLVIRQKLFGEEHVQTARSYHSLGGTQRALGDLTSALQSFQRALDIRLGLFGEEHSYTAAVYTESLGLTQCLQGDFASALQSLQRALDITVKLFGEEHSNTADLFQFLGDTRRAQGDLTSALQSLQRALDIRIKLFGEEHSITARSYCSLGFIQHAQGDWSSALKSKQRALDIIRKLFGEEHLKTADSYLSLGDTQHAQGDFTSAFQSKQRALKTTMKLFLQDIAKAESHI